MYLFTQEIRTYTDVKDQVNIHILLIFLSNEDGLFAV